MYQLPKPKNLRRKLTPLSPDHASSVAATPASRGTEAHPEVVDPLCNYNPKRRRLNEALDGAGQ